MSYLIPFPSAPPLHLMDDQQGGALLPPSSCYKGSTIVSRGSNGGSSSQQRTQWLDGLVALQRVDDLFRRHDKLVRRAHILTFGLAGAVLLYVIDLFVLWLKGNFGDDRGDLDPFDLNQHSKNETVATKMIMLNSIVLVCTVGFSVFLKCKVGSSCPRPPSTFSFPTVFFSVEKKNECSCILYNIKRTSYPVEYNPSRFRVSAS